MELATGGIIDLHVHCGRSEVFGRQAVQSYISPRTLIELYDELGIERGVIQPMVNPEFNPSPQSNEEILDICCEYPDRFSAFCNIDPRMLRSTPDAAFDELLARYKEAGCLGVGEICALLPFDDPLVDNLLASCERLRMPVLFHLAPALQGYYGLYDEPGLPRLERALRSFPDLVFLGHSQPFWAEIAPLQDLSPGERNRYPTGPVKIPGRVIELMHRYPNLHGDLCGNSAHNALTRDPAFGIRFLHEFGDRLYFGTDIVGENNRPKMNGYLSELLKSGHIDSVLYEKIMRGNALKLLGLS